MTRLRQGYGGQASDAGPITGGNESLFGRHGAVTSQGSMTGFLDFARNEDS